MKDAVIVVDSNRDYEEIDIIDAEIDDDRPEFRTTLYQGRLYWVHGGKGTRVDNFINVSRPL